MNTNIDIQTVEGFGDEWSRFDQTLLGNQELEELFNGYFKIFPWSALPDKAVGFDLGCGSGRWDKCVAPKVGHLHCIDASPKALEVAKGNLADFPNCEFHLASVDNMPLENNSMDFGYSLGVLHHIPDTASGIKACVDKLKPGAPFLLYLYYAFDNRPWWYRQIWRISNLLRKAISNSPTLIRYWLSQVIAAIVYFPLARLAILFESIGFDVSNFPLSSYRQLSFYTMRTDALDRFGTKLEQRFKANEISHMMENAGLEEITFSDIIPYWCAVGYKRR